LDEHRKEPLKVVDRRLFTREGERRQSAEGEAVPAPQAREPEPPIQLPQPPPEPGEAVANPLFGELVGFLADYALMGLRGGAPLSNFTVFIDFLEMLREKTKGRLAPAELQLLEEALGEMKLVFLQMNKKPGGKEP
jgi:hypothetical protein